MGDSVLMIDQSGANAGRLSPKAREGEGDELPSDQWPRHRDFIEVYVSAVEHPDHFWVQVISAKSTQLDRLVDNMTSHYQFTTQQPSQAIQPNPGDIVAAPFTHDASWYRARVVEVQDKMVDVYYVDFGDNGLVPLDKVRTLR